MRRWLVLLVLTSCGRYGFEIDPRLGDATVGDVVAGDGTHTSSSDAPGGCLGNGPYLELVQLVDNAGTLGVAFCATGISGELTASLIESTGAARSTVVVPVAQTDLSLLVGPAMCLGCFVRLVAGGLTVESAPADYAGD